MEYNFCNLDNGLLENVTSTLAKNLFDGISASVIRERYLEMISNFNRPFDSWSKKRGYSYASFGDMAIPIENIKEISLPEAMNIGIDLPTWFNYSDMNIKIMIVGMEPLRRYDFPNHATISSPFGLHHFNNKRNPSRNLIYKFIRQLKERNFSMYFTDISKIYYLKQNKKQVENSSISVEIFKEELNFLKPDYILAFGKSALLRLENFYNRSSITKVSKILMLTHPAGRKGSKHYYEYLLSEMDKTHTTGIDKSRA